MDVAGGSFDRQLALPHPNFQNMFGGSSATAWPTNYSPSSLASASPRHRTPSGSSSGDSEPAPFGRLLPEPLHSVLSVSCAWPGWNGTMSYHRDSEEIRSLFHNWEVPPYEPDMTSCVGNGSIINNGRMEKFISNMLQGTSLDPLEGHHKVFPIMCTGCGMFRAAGKCRDCEVILCKQCVFAHMRSRLTKDHIVLSFPDDIANAVGPNTNFPSTSSSPNSLHLSPMNHPLCELHQSKINLYCDTCSKPVCKDCAHRSHRSHKVIYLQDVLEETRMRSARLLTEAQNGLRTMQSGIEKVSEMSQKVEQKFVEVQKEVTGTARRYIMAIEERERYLLNQLERVRQMKGKSLLLQLESLKNIRLRLSGCIDLLSKELDKGPAIGLLKVADHVSAELHQIRSLHTSVFPCEDDLFSFVPSDQVIYRALQTFGNVKSSGFAGATEVQGRVPRTAPTGKVSAFIVRVRNHLKELHCFGQEMLTAILVQPDGTVITPDITDQGDGMYKISFCPQVEGEHALHVRLRGKSIPHSPFKIKVRACRSYTNLGKPLLCFGSEGEGDGMLCRPWGICCNKEGQLIVADRSNNRIQVFDSNGKFVFKFGSQGSSPGQFDRPAGIAADKDSNIIVADKDNHRIQIFSKGGKFLHMFGEKGTKPGQFNYPWDVAVNGDGDIIVSDTRNHRIQMFRADGSFMSKYGFEGSSNMWKHFDSPRGVSFTPDGSIIVTDFNNHRLVVIESNFSNARFLGSEGAGPKQFLRPQGVVVDEDGYIIVADSRNHRIQIFDIDGSVVSQFGTPGKNIGELDRPSGICVTADGKIVVVDFGNNRIQVF